MYNRWQLRNTDISVGEADQLISYDTHVISVNNIATIEIKPIQNWNWDQTVNLDAKHYDGARRFIINEGTRFSGPLSMEQDATVLPRKLQGSTYIEFGKDTKNTLIIS